MLEPQIYQNPPLITVFGGAGFVGRYVAEALTKRGYRVRIACRRPEKAYYMLQIGSVGQLQMLKADIGDRRSVARALSGAAAAVYLAGAAVSSRKNSFHKLYAEGAENVAALAAQAGIKLIHISALSAGLEQAAGAYLRAKAEGEKRVRAAHHGAVILRPSLIFGREDRFFNRFANWARFTPLMPLFGGGEAKIQPVYVGDVAEAIARVIEGQGKAGQIYELGGREALSFRALMEEMLSIIRRRRSFINLPAPLALLWGGLWGLAGKIPFVPAVITAAEVKMLCYDSIVSEAAQREGRSLTGLGIAPAAMDALLPAYLWRFRAGGQFSRALS